jgi:hypothetical protein
MDAQELEALMGFEPGELERDAAAYEADEWPSGTTARLGRPPVSDEPTRVVSGRVPASIADAFAEKARRAGQTRAERLRQLVAADVREAS